MTKKTLPGVDDYTKLIQGIWKDQTRTSVKYLDTLQQQLFEKANFMEEIQPQLDKILEKAAPTMEKHIEQFYAAGKTLGYDQMKVASFFGNSDRHALFTLKNYNFDLIRNASNDLINGIRREVWQGTARGDAVDVIAKEILRLPMEPLQTSSGRMISPQVRADMIARTESMRALNQGTLLSFQQYGVEMVEVPPSGTEGDWNCDCEDIVDGSPYPINEAPVLPDHPNCTHTYSPVMEAVSGVMDPNEYVNLVLEEPVSTELGGQTLLLNR